MMNQALITKYLMNQALNRKSKMIILHVSSREGHTPVVSLLLSQEGVDVNISDEVC